LKKIFLCIGLLTLVFFLLAPAISLILPKKLREHTYRELLMHIVALRESRSEASSSDIANKLLYYTTKNTLLNPGDAIPYEGKSLDYLINGLVYCDYQADILATLCAHRGISARYCMLMDKDGVSPHTVAEIYIDGKWGVFDVAENCYYTTILGGPASIEDLSKNPYLIFDNRRWQEIKRQSEAGFNNKVTYYQRMFPVPMPPQRSSSKIKRITLFDRIGFIYYATLGDTFLRPYQDYYLKIKTEDMHGAEKLYYYARNYQLTYRSDESIALYNQLIGSYPDAPYFNKSVIFLSFVYMDQKKDYPLAIKTLGILADGPPGPYKNYALYYMGRCYQLLGQDERSQEYLNKSGMLVLLDPALAN